jgi:hypothetical protein
MTTFSCLESAEQMRAQTRQQAKRLRERLGISLTAARDILAQEVYRCKNWHDLKGRIDAGAHHAAHLVLASASSENFQSDLRRREVAIARAIGGRVLANTNLAGMLETVRYVFTQREQATTVQDIATPLHASPWRPAGIGPDAYAVIEAFANVDGQPIKLLGTRVYLPEYMNLPRHLQERAHYAARYGESIAIMWSDPKGWFDTACAYLGGLDDDADEWPEFDAPRLPLDRAMKRHAKWFDGVMRYWSNAGSYGDKDEMFQPLVTAQGTYLVFGIPIAHDRDDAPAVTSIDCGDGGNTSTLAHIGGQAVRIESFTVDPHTGEHDDDYGEHVDAVSTALFQHPCYCRPTSGRVYFVTPVVDFDIRHALALDMTSAPGQEVFALKTDRIEVLDDLLKLIRRRDVVWFDSAFGRRYIATLHMPGRDFDGFSLSLDLRGDACWYSSNMVTTVVWESAIDSCTAHLELQPELLALIDALGAKTIMDAARDGLTLRRPAGFRESLKNADAPRSGFAEAPAALRRKFRYGRLGAGMSIDDLLSHANLRHTRFRRDHL